MNTEFDFKDNGQHTVYIRHVPMAALPNDVREQAPGLDGLYAVYDADGERLALVRDRNMAFILARQNDFAPVSVH